MIRIPGGCIALHPPLYLRLRRDPRCAATTSDYVHAAIAVTVFLGVVVVSPPVSLCLFPGPQPGTSSIRSVWSMFVPLVVTLAGGVAVALLDTPLRAPLGFGCCARHTGAAVRGAAAVAVPGADQAVQMEDGQAVEQAEAGVQALASSTVESFPGGSAVDVPAECVGAVCGLRAHTHIRVPAAWRATEPLPVLVQTSPLRTRSMPVV